MFNGEFREMVVRYMLCGGSSGGRDDRSLDRPIDKAFIARFRKASR